MLGHVGTYLAAESTASKLPSNGVPEMKADRVLRGLACQDLLAFYFPTLCLARHHVTRPGRRERGAGVSRSECEQCGLVRGGELGEQGISRPCTVCRSRLLSAAAGPRCLPAAKVTPDTPAIGISGSQPLRQASGRHATMAVGEVELQRNILALFWTARLTLSRMSCSVCCDLSLHAQVPWPP